MPPSASSKRPAREYTAPVKEPFSWPKSSLSSSVSGSAAQATFTKGLLRLGLFWCSAWAKSSLPVPLSPRRSTDDVEGATCRTVLNADSISGLSPTRFSRRYLWSRRSRRTRVSSRSCFFSMVFCSTTSSSSMSMGFGR